MPAKKKSGFNKVNKKVDPKPVEKVEDKVEEVVEDIKEETAGEEESQVEKVENKVDDNVLTTKEKGENKDVVYWNEKRPDTIEVECTASRGKMQKWVRYYVIESVLQAYPKNLKRI